MTSFEVPLDRCGQLFVVHRPVRKLFYGLKLKKRIKIKKGAKVIGTGFEPVPPKRLVPETSALDRSATQPRLVAARAGRFACIKMLRETKTSDTGNRTPGICVTGRDVTNYTNSDS